MPGRYISLLLIIFLVVFSVSGCNNSDNEFQEIEQTDASPDDDFIETDKSMNDNSGKKGSAANEYTEMISWKYVTMPSNIFISSMASTEEIFVAAGVESTSTHSASGAEGVIFTSSQEYGPWVPVYIDAWVNSVIWTGKEFAAVGNGGKVCVSEDGLNWSNIDSGTTRNLYDIIWAENQFIVIGENGTTITSHDGINWDPQPVVIQNDLHKLIHNGKIYVAIGNEGTVLRSQDGSAWEVQETGVQQDLRNITWDGNSFISISDGGGGGRNTVLIRSFDGITWESQPVSIPRSYKYDLIWVNNVFVLICDQDIYTSEDGASWNLVEDTPGRFRDVYWTGNNFVAAGVGVYATSPDGLNWNSQNVAEDAVRQDIYGSTWAVNKLLATVETGRMLTSENLVEWESFSPEGMPVDLYHFYDVAWSGDLYVAVGTWGKIFTSEDGINWTPRISGTEMTIMKVIWTGEQFVAVGKRKPPGDDEMNILTSVDGISWILRRSGTLNALNDVVWSGDQLVAVGAEGTILTSVSGESWNEQSSLLVQTLKSVTIGKDGLYVAVGSNIVTSENGYDWTVIDVPFRFRGTINSVVWTGNHYVAVGDNGIVFNSIDGKIWEQMQSVTINSLFDLTLTDDGILATGLNGIILLSQ